MNVAPAIFRSAVTASFCCTALLTGCSGSQAETATPSDHEGEQDKQAETASPPGAPPAESAETSQRLGFHDALERSRSRYPDAPAIEVEREVEDGQELLEVEFLVDGEVVEVYFHPVSGDFVREQTEELDAKEIEQLPALAKALQADDVSMAHALDLALERYDEATLHEVELEMHDGELVLEIAVKGPDGEITEWIHDPRNGDKLGEETDEEHRVEPAP